MPWYEVIRKMQIREVIQVEADNEEQAMTIAQDDCGNIEVLNESDMGWEVNYNSIREISKIIEE